MRDQATLREVLRILPAFRINQREPRPLNLAIHIISDGFAFLHIAGVWWTMCDNGGEFMIGVVNYRGPLTDPSVPLNSGSVALDAGTVAERCASVFLGEAIDYDSRLDPETLEAIMETYEQS